MHPGFPAYPGNGYATQRTEKAPRYRRRRGTGGRHGSFRISHDNFSSSSSSSHAQQYPVEWASSPRWKEFDDAYFQSYSQIGIHEEMIKDHVRTETYRNAILRHQNLISGKVVMDVGCGTGILSIFCALAGARRVYAIEASDIAAQASEVVSANNLSDKVIVIHEKVEKVSIEEKVDVIISEWMGYMLLYESMLSSVIFARDNWLKQGGLILPSHATLYMAPVTHSERYSESIDFWRDVYGIDMSVMLPLAKQCAFEEPSVETISVENVLTWPFVVKFIDCYTVTARELESITAKYNFTSMLRAPLHGFAFWFDAEFNGPSTFPTNDNLLSGGSTSNLYSTAYNNQTRKKAKYDQVLVLSTAPEDEPTHWQQTILYLYEPIEVIQDQVIEGSITISQSMENPRFLNIHLEYSSGGRSFIKESIMR
ncbi:probable protein arginine N-methyltransferase 6 [Phalaenopsis equestris]|uniref:probable protein arginine N-methyltransferase 6 n=1 Tax=Phalaenopsis equestris TaxID=78828 RepID=UPI0009E2F77A|nr:probable protein arginine N-methyltransferase 6 [Phalaenopsis equestris]